MQQVAKWIALFALAIATPGNAVSGDETTAGLDANWSELGRTVAEGDFDAYAAGYHEDAVLVSLHSGNSFPIAKALEGWQQGFIDTREGKTTASVEFRFSQRLHDETTAHETGIFRYSFQSEAGETAVQYVHFEALLVKKDRWLMIMEYQKASATQEEWDALL